MPRTIAQIFSKEFGFESKKLNSLARILYHFDAFEDLSKVENHQQSDLDKILQKEISEKDLNDVLQKNIFQKIRGTKERQQIDPSNAFSDEIKQQLMQDFKNIDFVAEITPKKEKEYKSVIIFGATQAGMESRFNDFLEYFSPKINKGHKEIFILAGHREGWLDSEIFAKKILLDRINSSLENKGESKKTMESLQQEIDEVYANPAFHSLAEKRKGAVEHFQEKYEIKFPTETDIAQKIVESKKADLDGFKITYINAEKKPDGSRPNTVDTLIAFVADVKSRESFEFNSVLAISNQPFVSAQAMAINNADPDLIQAGIDVVGKEMIGAVDKLNILACELCGTINRCPLFQEKKIENDKNPQPLTRLESGRVARVSLDSSISQGGKSLG
jgi:hypothetical protein